MKSNIKIKLIILAVITVVLFTGCGSENPANKTDTNINNTESETSDNMSETAKITQTETEQTANITGPKTIAADDKSYFFGISPTDSNYISDEEWANYKLIGIKTLRIHLQASHSWDDYDKVAQRAAKEGIEVMMLVSYESYTGKSESINLGWGPIMHFTNSPDLIDVLAKAIPHFKNEGVTAWEIWNEENGMWNLTPDEYASLITQVYEKCKYTDKWDENATIVFGGIDAVNVGFSQGINSGSGDWLTRFYKTDAYKAFKEKYNRSPFDVMAVHPYNTIDADANLNVTENDLQTALKGVVLNNMKRNGDENMPVWLTELGDQNSDDAKNAKILELYMKTAYDIPQVTRFHWFKYYYEGSDYSIVNPDGTPRPSLYAYAQVVKDLTGK